MPCIQHPHAGARGGTSLRNNAADAADSSRHDNGTAGKINVHHRMIVLFRRRIQ